MSGISCRPAYSEYPRFGVTVLTISRPATSTINVDATRRDGFRLIPNDTFAIRKQIDIHNHQQNGCNDSDIIESVHGAFYFQPQHCTSSDLPLIEEVTLSAFLSDTPSACWSRAVCSYLCSRPVAHFGVMPAGSFQRLFQS